MKNLWSKFVKEKGAKLSFASFARKVPKGYKSIKHTAWWQCLCLKHMNRKLKTDIMRRSEDPMLLICFWRNNSEQCLPWRWDIKIGRLIDCYGLNIISATVAIFTAENHFLVRMDYSENYECRYQDKTSSVFYNSHLLTLHPMIAYQRE